MVITAKFAGKCTRCQGQIKAGASIEWAKGQGASHVECPVKATPQVTCRQPGCSWIGTTYTGEGGRDQHERTHPVGTTRCSYRGCTNRATMTTSSGPGCSTHYDDLS